MFKSELFHFFFDRLRPPGNCNMKRVIAVYLKVGKEEGKKEGRQTERLRKETNDQKANKATKINKPWDQPSFAIFCKLQ